MLRMCAVSQIFFQQLNMSGYKIQESGKEIGTRQLPKTGSEMALASENLKPIARLASTNRNKIIFVRLMLCF